MHNSNLIFDIRLAPNKGNVRETFFLNQLRYKNQFFASKTTDFVVDCLYEFEIGDKTKIQKQIKDLQNAFVVKDNIEIGSNNNIPLWLFGFLY